MLLLVGYVDEPMGYFCCVFPLVELCLFLDFGVGVVKNLFADFSQLAFCGIYEAACRVVGEVVLMIFQSSKGLLFCDKTILLISQLTGVF